MWLVGAASRRDLFNLVQDSINRGETPLLQESRAVQSYLIQKNSLDWGF